jgi:Uma2 family endonuclease
MVTTGDGMTTLAIATEARVILDGVRWQTYEGLLGDLSEHRKARLAYDHGTLEIMTPYFAHEWLNRLLADIITALAFGKHLPIEQGGSTTFRREDVARGFEPDSCFYFGDQAVAIRGRDRVDLHSDPPPALVVEIDLTHPSLDKFPIYAALGVAEVWRCDGQHIWFYQLGPHGYTPVETSVVLDRVTTQDIASLIERGRQMERQVLFDEVRTWAGR